MDRRSEFYGHRLNKKEAASLDKIVEVMCYMEEQIKEEGDQAELGDSTGELMDAADQFMVALGVYDKGIL